MPAQRFEGQTLAERLVSTGSTLLKISSSGKLERKHVWVSEGYLKWEPSRKPGDGSGFGELVAGKLFGPFARLAPSGLTFASVLFSFLSLPLQSLCTS